MSDIIGSMSATCLSLSFKLRGHGIHVINARVYFVANFTPFAMHEIVSKYTIMHFGIDHVVIKMRPCSNR